MERLWVMGLPTSGQVVIRIYNILHPRGTKAGDKASFAPAVVSGLGLEDQAETGNSPTALGRGGWTALGEGLGWSCFCFSREAEESDRACPGGLVAGMASFLGRVSTKPFPQLLHSSNCSFLACW